MKNLARRRPPLSLFSFLHTSSTLSFSPSPFSPLLYSMFLPKSATPNCVLSLNHAFYLSIRSRSLALYHIFWLSIALLPSPKPSTLSLSITEAVRASSSSSSPPPSHIRSSSIIPSCLFIRVIFFFCFELKCMFSEWNWISNN